MNETHKIYVEKMEEVKRRLAFSKYQLAEYGSKKEIFFLENAILHLRKALENVAYAAIAPNKEAYAKLRQSAEKPIDFRKDYNGSKIIKLLGKVNKDFYPTPLLSPIQIDKGRWHFERRQGNYLTKNEFESTYDRLGKYLHSDNPWDHDKGFMNIAKDLPSIYEKIEALLEWHFTVVRHEKFGGLWVIEFGTSGKPARVVVGMAKGEFMVL